MSKVSICIPVYKDLNGLKRLINSIKKQTFTDFEIIVTDDTPDLSISDHISEIAVNGKICLDSGHEADIFYYHNETPLGAAGNWNYSIGLSGSDYIKIMHQDDFFTSEDSLERFVKLLDGAPAAILGFSGSRQVTISEENPEDLSVFYDRHISEENLELISKDWRNLFLGGFIGAPSAVIYRNCDKRFDPELNWLIDSDFYMNLLKDNRNCFAYDYDPLVCIGVSSSQLTNSCINNGALNIFEYKHLYMKYGLKTEDAYRDKLADIVIEYGGNYKDLEETGLEPSVYKRRLSVHRKERAAFLAGVVLKKLNLRKN